MLERSQTLLLHAGGVFQGKFIQTRNVFIKKFTRPLASTQNYEIRSTNNVKDPTKNDNKTMRLAKRIAMSGICSRREAEKMIQEEKVTINGSIVTELGTLVNLKTDTVSVNGKLINNKQRRTRVWIAHKLRGELVTLNDPQGRPTIFDRLKVMGLTHHLMPVGRLDFNTEGLLLFTNDGDYARKLEHPKYEVSRHYRALVRGEVAASKIEELRRGPLIDGVKYRPFHIKIQSHDKKDSWLLVKISEGKNREIRKALAHVRLVVKELIRVQYGPYRLADLPAGSVLEMRPKPFLSASSTGKSLKKKKKHNKNIEI